MSGGILQSEIATPTNRHDAPLLGPMLRLDRALPEGTDVSQITQLEHWVTRTIPNLERVVKRDVVHE